MEIQEILKEKAKNDPKLQESIDFLGGYGGGFGSGSEGLFSSGGNLWNVLGASGSAGGFYAAYLKLNLLWFNRQQRYACRIAYISNGLAHSAVDKLCVLTLGSGLEFACENKAKQKRIDEWVRENNYCERSKHAFKQMIIDGENFQRIFGTEVRFIDPDLIYGTSSKNPTDNYTSYTGLVYDETDNEKVKGYLVHQLPFYEDNGVGKFVDAKYIQHRKLAEWGQPRGFSMLLPILNDLYACDYLTLDLMAAAEVLARYPLIRKHNAPQQAVDQFRAELQTQNPYPVGQNGFPPVPGNPSNLQQVPRGTIHDSDSITDYVVPDGLDTKGSLDNYHESLRKIAGQMMLPTDFFTGDSGDKNAYAGALVSNSFITRQIEAMQTSWEYYELELLEMVGIDPDGVQCIFPEVSLVDRKAEAELLKILMDKRMLSKQTGAKTFELDYAKELELIQQEEIMDPIENQPDQIEKENNSDNKENKS